MKPPKVGVEEGKAEGFADGIAEGDTVGCVMVGACVNS